MKCLMREYSRFKKNATVAIKVNFGIVLFLISLENFKCLTSLENFDLFYLTTNMSLNRVKEFK